MSERSSSNIAMLSILAGLTGAGIALLFAPRSGKVTRNKIGSKANELKGLAEDNINHAKENISTGLDRTRDSLTEALNKTNRKVRDQYDEFRETDTRTGNKISPVIRAWEEEV